MARLATCFVEQAPEAPLPRRALAEATGSLLLVLAASGAGLTAHRLAPSTPGLGLAMSAVATAAALVGLIIAFGAVSGGHFNPLITGLQWLSRERGAACTLAYVAAQIVGAILGGLLAKALFAEGSIEAVAPPLGATMVASEAVAAAGLMVVVFACSRSARREAGPFAVGGWVLAAILATPSGSYANPAIAIAALFAAGPMALPAQTVLLYVPAEVAGALLAAGVIAFTFPQAAAVSESSQKALAP